MKGSEFGKTIEEILKKHKCFRDNLVLRVVMQTELRHLMFEIIGKDEEYIEGMPGKILMEERNGFRQSLREQVE